MRAVNALVKPEMLTKLASSFSKSRINPGVSNFIVSKNPALKQLVRVPITQTSTSTTFFAQIPARLPSPRYYHERVIDHYEKPRNVGKFDKNAPDVGTGLVGAPECGDVMKLQIRVDENGQIVDSCFKTFGCGSAIASSSYVTEAIKGKHIEEAAKIKNTDIAKHLNLPPVKLHCSMLAEDAIKAAIADLKKKKEAQATSANAQSANNVFKDTAKTLAQ